MRAILAAAVVALVLSLSSAAVMQSADDSWPGGNGSAFQTADDSWPGGNG